MDLNNPDEPVIVVFNHEGKVFHAGHPESMDKKELGEYAIKGYEIKKMTITEYREKKYEWSFGKKNH